MSPKPTDANHCCRCSSTLGEAVKVQPQRIDDGDGNYETYCPRCAVWHRYHEPSEQGTHGQPRLNASQMCAAKCQFCQWTMVSFGAEPGRRLRCGHCGKPGAIPIPIPKDGLSPTDADAIRDAQNEAKKAS